MGPPLLHTNTRVCTRAQDDVCLTKQAPTNPPNQPSRQTNDERPRLVGAGPAPAHHERDGAGVQRSHLAREIPARARQLGIGGLAVHLVVAYHPQARHRLAVCVHLRAWPGRRHACRGSGRGDAMAPRPTPQIQAPPLRSPRTCLEQGRLKGGHQGGEGVHQRHRVRHAHDAILDAAQQHSIHCVRRILDRVQQNLQHRPALHGVWATHPRPSPHPSRSAP